MSMEGGLKMSTVPARTRSRARGMRRAPGLAGALPTTDGSVTDRMALRSRAVVPWRALLAAALLSLMLGAGL
jgi:hypothetical protein